MIANSQKFLVINADDFGLAPKTNLAILQALREGILRSTSLLVTCPGFSHAISVIKRNPTLSVGIHLSLTLGKPVSRIRDVPRLVTGSGIFNPSYGYYLFRADTELRKQAELEFSRQIEKCLNEGVTISHIDSQSHIHMIPALFEITVRLAEKYRIHFVRLSRDRLHGADGITETLRPLTTNNIIKLALLNSLSIPDAALLRSFPNIKTPSAYYGVWHTGLVDKAVLRYIFATIKPGVTEISLHPGYSVNDTDFDFRSQHMHTFMVSPSRIKERDALTDKQIKNLIKYHGITLTNYRLLSV